MGIKVVKDLVHGYIYMDKEIQRCVDISYFQRLHRIKQLTCTLLFPSVNHTRYEHSLGVMKLACDFFDRLKNDFLKYGKTEKELENLKNHLQFAALLHDVGHAPFSHLGEKFLDKKDILLGIKNILNDDEIFNDIFISDSIGSSHEIMSCYAILKVFKKYLPMTIDTTFLCRMIIGNCYFSQDKWAENICINILNSKSIDVDKIDYLMRDNHMTGEIAPSLDIERLLASVSIDKNRNLCFIAKGLPAIQCVIDSRDLLYLWVYHHHISVYTEFLLGEIIHTCIVENKLYRDRFFSKEAIVDNLICDDDVYSFLRQVYIEEKNSSRSSYLKKLTAQYFERKFLKPIWKTIYEYYEFEKDWILHKYISDQNHLNNILQDSDRVKKIETAIQNKLGLERGDIFLITQHNKFYHAMNNVMLEIKIRNKKILLADLLPQKNFKKFKDISFFIFVTKEKKKEAYQSFLDEIKKLNS